MNADMIFKYRLEPDSLKKLKALNNRRLEELIAEAILKYQPRSVFLSDGSPADMQRIRRESIRRGEERPLLLPVHTVHYDGYHDQGRDPANTQILTPGGTSLGQGVNIREREEGLHEIEKIMDGIMVGRDMVVSFYSLGPLGTEFAIPCVQITDSFYVAHSEDILYRQGYEAFRGREEGEAFFGFLHSVGAQRQGVSRDIDHRRIFIDLQSSFVYSANTQYAGNTVAAKKLAHRLAIRNAAGEGWLAEHLFISGVPSYEGDGKSYIAGAFPSWCGKTSTSMLFDVVGDDLAHLRKKDGLVYAANVERGMFGVIKDVNPQDDPYIHEILVKSGEIIFSNVLDVDGRPYWQGMGRVDVPLRGINHSGAWWQGKHDGKGKAVPLSHDNARFCVALKEIKNYDPTQVVHLEGIIYGGRSSKRPVPVSQSYGWVHGVCYGASIESEPTAATVGQAGAKVIINPMANQEFLSIPTGTYLENHIKFGKDLKEHPKVFYVNYFLRDEEGNFLNTKMDKKVWIRWIERRIRGKLGAYATPIGFIPKYEDVAELFRRELDTPYPREEYERQFTIRAPELLEKLDIVEACYVAEQKTSQVPEDIFRMVRIQRELLTEAQSRLGSYISPFEFEGYEAPAALAQPF